MWDDATENSSTPTMKSQTTDIQTKLYNLAEKWKFDFFRSRESNVTNINDILETSSTAVTIDYDEAQKMVARIYCVICQRPIRIGYLKHNTRNGETYNFSNTNYFHHLKMHSVMRHVARTKKNHDPVEVDMIPKIDPSDDLV